MKVMNKQRLGLAAASAVVAISLPLAAFAAFGPDRPTYSCNSAGQCVGADHVVFDSFVNNPNYDQHDERNFLTVRPASNPAGTGYVNTINLVPGQEYVVRAYVHNNAQQDLSGVNDYIAHDTTFKVSLPSTVNGSADATGTISASNANPGSVFDTVTFTGSNVQLSYDLGSATWTSNGASNGAPLSDNITSSGALLGYNAINGDLPGCFQYSGYVSFKVRAESIPTPPSTPPSTPTPSVTPAAAPLPQTGPAEVAGLAGMAGSGAIGYGVMSYRRSKQALLDKLRGRK